MLQWVLLKLLAMDTLNYLWLRAWRSTILSRARHHGRLAHVSRLLLAVVTEIVVHRVDLLILQKLQLLERRREVNLRLEEFV